jgi:hypothetical protein
MHLKNPNFFIAQSVYGSHLSKSEGEHALSDVSEAFQRSSDTLGQAEQNQQIDKNGRRLIGKLVDFLSQTPAEQVVAETKVEHDRVTKEAQTRIGAWVDANTIHILGAQPEERDRWQKLVDRRLAAENLHLGATKAYLEGERAMKSLLAAQQNVSSGQMGELFDMISSNKIVSIASNSATRSAKVSGQDALEQANTFLKTYNDTFVPSDKQKFGDLDLLVDLTTNLPVDLLSFFDLQKLGGLSSKIDSAIEKISGPLQQVSAIKRGLELVVVDVSIDMENMILPLRSKLETTIPEPLKPLVDPDRKINYKSFSSLRSEMVVDWDAARKVINSAANERNQISPRQLTEESPGLG